MLEVSTNTWLSEATELSRRPISPKSPPKASSSSLSIVPKPVFTSAIREITPLATVSTSQVHRPNDLPRYLRIPIPSPSRGHHAQAQAIQTCRYAQERGRPVHTSVSPESNLGQNSRVSGSNCLPTAQSLHREPSHSKLKEYEDEDENTDDIPLGYPYESCTDVLIFAREYLCGMVNLVMTWLEGRRGMRAST